MHLVNSTLKPRTLTRRASSRAWLVQVTHSAQVARIAQIACSAQVARIAQIACFTLVVGALGIGTAHAQAAKTAPKATATQGTASNPHVATASKPRASNRPAASAKPAASSKASAAGSTSPAPAVPKGHPLPPGHAAVSPHGASPHGVSPHGRGMEIGTLLKGGPFSSAKHGQQAELARAGQRFQPDAQVEFSKMLPPGTIGVLLRDAEGNAKAGTEVKLIAVRESIAEGNKTTYHKTITDLEGRAGFVKQPTDTSHHYEVVVELDGARYSTGQFRLKQDAGAFVALYVYPTTTNPEDTFLAVRALYGIEPRNDIFQMQTLFRIYNTNPITWIAKDYRVDLPPGAKAFRPMQRTDDITLSFVDDAVLVSGTFTPGQHEFAFAYQIDNPGEATATVAFPTIPNITDARVVLEASSSMGLSVRGFGAAIQTHGTVGQNALMAEQDFLRPLRPGPKTYVATITGLPTRGRGPLVAAGIAGLLALLGLAISRDKKRQISEEDRQTARQLLLDELVAVERAKNAKEIGPKTYDRTRRMLLDAIARLETAAST